MADLDGLIRYRKHIVDEKQKLLAALFREYELLENERLAVLKRIEDEKKAATDLNDIETQAALGLFVNASMKKAERLLLKMSELDIKIQKAQENVRAAFAEQKKAEIVQRKRQDEEDAEQKQKETQLLDDIAIERFARSKDTGNNE